MSHPKVSVCVVAYNQEKYIRKCLQSIMDQQRSFDVEVIVGDDGSTDGTRDIIREFYDRYPDVFKPVFHARNLGPFKNYLFVHREASGQYVAHMDGDDYWLPGKLACQVDFLDKHVECSAVYTNADVVSQAGAHLGVFTGPIRSVFDTSYLLSRGNFICHSSMLYRSKFGSFAFSVKEDFIDFHIHEKLSEKGLLGFVNTPLVAYRFESSGSLLKARNDRIRFLYLQVFRDADLTKVKIGALYAGLSTFMANILLSDVSSGRGFRQSGLIVALRSLEFMNFLLFRGFLLAALIRVLFKRTLARLLSDRERVFYPRY